VDLTSRADRLLARTLAGTEARRTVTGATLGALATAACFAASAAIVAAARLALHLTPRCQLRSDPTSSVVTALVLLWNHRLAALLSLALIAGVLVGRLVSGSWRGAAATCGVLAFSALAAAGAHLSPWSTGAAWPPLLSGLAAAAVGGAGWLRPCRLACYARLPCTT
jgi:hypothetical protein